MRISVSALSALPSPARIETGVFLISMSLERERQRLGPAHAYPCYVEPISDAAIAK